MDGKLSCTYTHSHTLEMADERFSKSSKAVCLSSVCPCPFRSIPPSVKQSPPMETDTLSQEWHTHTHTVYFTVCCNTFAFFIWSVSSFWVFINRELKSYLKIWIAQQCPLHFFGTFTETCFSCQYSHILYRLCDMYIPIIFFGMKCFY